MMNQNKKSPFNRIVLVSHQLKKLEEWINLKGYKILKTNKLGDEIIAESKTIVLSIRQKSLHQLFSLLHECRPFINKK